MRIGEVKVSTVDTEMSLQKDGFEPDTTAYDRERNRRYRRRGRDKWAERDSWDPSLPAPEAVYSDEEMDMIIRRRHGGEPPDGMWNARSRLFSPVGAGLTDNRWVKKDTTWCSVVLEPSKSTKASKRSASKAAGTGYAFVSGS